MWKHGRSWIGIAALVSLALPAGAEKADMPPAALRDTATHVVVGEVRAVYTRVERQGDWAYTRYLAEVRAGEVEKGDGIEAGDLVYARYWRRSWRGGGTPPTSTSGHRGLPEEGATLRIHLARNAYDGYAKDNTDGGFNVVFANGFEPLE